MWQRRKLQLLSFQKKPVALVFPSHCRKGAVCTGDSRWVLGAELPSMPRSHPAALKSFSFRGSLPFFQKLWLCYLANTLGQHPGKTPFQLILAQAFPSPLQTPTILTRNRRLKRKRKYLVTFRQPDPIFFHSQDLKGKQKNTQLLVSSPPGSLNDSYTPGRAWDLLAGLGTSV